MTDGDRMFPAIQTTEPGTRGIAWHPVPLVGEVLAGKSVP
ncbi:MAG: hypothetical protein JWR37_3599 [Mycobacterium sp.]|jgi:hypothetical protein|nr:hypothetical protein [Mycobacterium sp.]